ncbi:MAG TPA: class I SAM-dependent methyltransferase [Oligoflexia bacterium]|nr:class I SAM-dependent methyltransferase [Oligoflexia bacterium]HMP27493.1 class I SAM-dependent methyltransferase [Oligoflexia bacterium]
MNHLIDQTIESYQNNFDKYVARTPAEPSGDFKNWLDSFLSELPQKSRILEIGSATGRDARYFRAHGHETLCTDIMPQALQQLSEDGFETAVFDIRDQPHPEWLGQFDGFFANGVLQHLPPKLLKNTLANSTKVLKEGGIIAFSLKNGIGEEVSMAKLKAPRYYYYYQETEIKELLKQLPIEIIDVNYGANQKWVRFICRFKNR